MWDIECLCTQLLLPSAGDLDLIFLKANRIDEGDTTGASAEYDTCMAVDHCGKSTHVGVVATANCSLQGSLLSASCAWRLSAILAFRVLLTAWRWLSRTTSFASARRRTQLSSEPRSHLRHSRYDIDDNGCALASTFRCNVSMAAPSMRSTCLPATRTH